MPVIHPIPCGSVCKQVRLLLSCGHQRVVRHGTKRLVARARAKYLQEPVWCYLCSAKRQPEKFLGVEVVK